VFSSGGVALFVYQLFMFAPIEKLLGTLKTFRWGILVTIPGKFSDSTLTHQVTPCILYQLRLDPANNDHSSIKEKKIKKGANLHFFM
jgi:hypothetical protein